SSALASVLAVSSVDCIVYVLSGPNCDPDAAAPIVVLASALIVALLALIAALRKRKHERGAAIAKAQLMDDLPLGLGDIVRDRPLVTLAVTALGGLLAARHPTLVRDVIHIAARFRR